MCSQLTYSLTATSQKHKVKAYVMNTGAIANRSAASCKLSNARVFCHAVAFLVNESQVFQWQEEVGMKDKEPKGPRHAGQRKAAPSAKEEQVQAPASPVFLKQVLRLYTIQLLLGCQKEAGARAALPITLV